jgi:glycosyltransferase involved in cell wall biosynthesis
MEKINKISLIVPTYKQEKTIVKDINRLERSIKELQVDFEIIVVVDGFLDDTYKLLKRIRRPHIKVVGYEENKGKGYAVRFGMLQATGDVIGFIDGGMDIHPESISMLVNHMIWYDADVIIGSKLHPVSQVNYPFGRKVLSWGYRTIIRLLFGLKIRDTQVGMKLFKRRVVEDVFPRLLVKHFAFDIEVLAVAYSRGFKRIFEAPVKLSFNNTSSIVGADFWRAIFHMMWDTAAIFYRLKILHYYDKQKGKKIE